MAWRIVKQPNGQYARFSEIVDNFTSMCMTRDEAVEECKRYPGIGASEAEQKVSNADNDPKRWEEALGIIRTVHGDDELQSVLGVIASDGLSPAPSPQEEAQ